MDTTVTTVPPSPVFHSATLNKAAAWAAIERSAEELQVSAAAHGTAMSHEQAVAKATEEHPDLVTVWRDARSDPVPPPAAADEVDPKTIPAAQVQAAAAKLASREGISLSAAYDRVLDSREGVALRAAHSALHGRTDEAVTLAKAALRM